MPCPVHAATISLATTLSVLSRMDQSAPKPTTYTREQLFELVWAQSAVQLAKQIGVSDVAIAKACRKHQIPGIRI